MSRITTPDASDIPTTADLVVIGGGIVGCATAFWASQAGLNTVQVEKREALCTLTSANSAEGVRCQYDEPDNLNMTRRSLDVFEHFAEVVGLPGYDIAFHQQGYLFVTSAADGRAVLSARVRRQHAWGLPDVEYLDGDEARWRFPYLAPIVTAAIFRQRDGWVSVHEVTYGFAKGGTARIFLQTEVTGFQVDGQGIAAVETSRGPIHTRAVVIAAGPFSGKVARMAGVELPVVIERRQKAVVHSALIPQDGAMTIDVDTGAYWHPEPGGAIFGWGEAVPEKPAEPLDHVPADWDYPALVMEGCMRLNPFWEKVAGVCKREDVYASAGQYTITPDAKPILGPVAEVAGLYFNGGYSGHGIHGSPEGGRIVVETVLGRLKPEDNPFRRERFTEQVVKEKMIY
jgi:sarcosine oxidase subunit beta